MVYAPGDADVERTACILHRCRPYTWLRLVFLTVLTGPFTFRRGKCERLPPWQIALMTTKQNEQPALDWRSREVWHGCARRGWSAS